MPEPKCKGCLYCLVMDLGGPPDEIDCVCRHPEIRPSRDVWEDYFNRVAPAWCPLRKEKGE